MEYFLDFRQTRPRKQVPLRQQKKQKPPERARAQSIAIGQAIRFAYGVALPRISIS